VSCLLTNYTDFRGLVLRFGFRGTSRCAVPCDAVRGDGALRDEMSCAIPPKGAVRPCADDGVTDISMYDLPSLRSVERVQKTVDSCTGDRWGSYGSGHRSQDRTLFLLDSCDRLPSLA
jgi:hypothetical protein